MRFPLGNIIILFYWITTGDKLHHRFMLLCVEAARHLTVLPRMFGDVLLSPLKKKTNVLKKITTRIICIEAIEHSARIVSFYWK